MRSFAKKSVSWAAAALVLGTGVAHAGFGSDRFYFNGVLEYEYLEESGGTSEDILYTNLNFGFKPSDFGLGLPVGLQFGVEAFEINGENEVAVYPTVSLHPHFGRILLGIPRAALDSYVDLPIFAGNRLLDTLEGALLGRSFLTEIYFFSTDVPYGIRYDGKFGDLKLGASAHFLNGLNVYDLAAQYRLGGTGSISNVSITAGAEMLSTGGLSATNFLLGVDANLGQARGGLYYTSSGLFGVETVQLYVTLMPVSRLDLTASAVVLNFGGSDQTLFGISAEYQFPFGIYGQVGYITGDSFDSLLDLTVGLRF